MIVKHFLVGFFAVSLLLKSNAFQLRPGRVGRGAKSQAPNRPTNPSRVLIDSAGRSPSLTEDEPLVYRYYEEDFLLDLYGLSESLSPPDAQLLQEATKDHLNKRLDSSPVDLRVSSARVLEQEQQVKNDIPALSISMRILGQAVSTDAKAVATLSFEDVVLDIFAFNPSEFTRYLKGEDSDAFDDLLVSKASLLEPLYGTSSDSGDKNLVVLISASVGAAVLTTLLLCACVWRQSVGNKNSKAADVMLKKDEDDLAVASTWSSSDESSAEKAQPVTPTKLLRTFPTQEQALSPCIEELVGVDEGREDDSSAVSSQDDEIFSIKNWTYSSSSSSEGSDAGSVQVSLSMQSIDEFEASIRSTPPRKRRMLHDI